MLVKMDRVRGKYTEAELLNQGQGKDLSKMGLSSKNLYGVQDANEDDEIFGPEETIREQAQHWDGNEVRNYVNKCVYDGGEKFEHLSGPQFMSLTKAEVKQL